MFMIILFCAGLACKKTPLQMLPNTPTEQLKWLESNPSSTAFIPVYVHQGWATLGSESGPRVRLDDGALGVGLAQQISDCPRPCALTAELRWGPLLPLPQELTASEEPPTLSVLSVQDVPR